jgi:hypothetical protein
LVFYLFIYVYSMEVDTGAAACCMCLVVVVLIVFGVFAARSRGGCSLRQTSPKVDKKQPHHHLVCDKKLVEGFHNSCEELKKVSNSNCKCVPASDKLKNVVVKNRRRERKLNEYIKNQKKQLDIQKNLLRDTKDRLHGLKGTNKDEEYILASMETQIGGHIDGGHLENAHAAMAGMGGGAPGS